MTFRHPATTAYTADHPDCQQLNCVSPSYITCHFTFIYVTFRSRLIDRLRRLRAATLSCSCHEVYFVTFFHIKNRPSANSDGRLCEKHSLEIYPAGHPIGGLGRRRCPRDWTRIDPRGGPAVRSRTCSDSRCGRAAAMAYLLKSVGGLVGAAYQAEFAHLALAASTQYPVQYVDIHVYVSAELPGSPVRKL